MITLFCHVQDERIIIKPSLLTEDVHNFMAGLAEVKKPSAKRPDWSCTFTPASCWMIVSKGGEIFNIEADDRIRNTAMFFAQTLVAKLVDPHRTKLPPWRHQKEMFSFGLPRDGFLLDCFMGTGKTKVAVDLVMNWVNVRRVLILCPKSVLGVWFREFNKHCIIPFQMLLLSKGSNEKKSAQVQHFMGSPELQVVVVNYESAWRTPLSDTLLTKKWDVVICDESQRIARHGTKQSEFAYNLVERSRKRICLTGTPYPQGQHSIFGQARFVDPGFFGTSWVRFRNTYCEVGTFGADHIVGYKNTQQFSKICSLFIYHVGQEVLDLPPVMHEKIPLELTDKTRKIYNKLEEELCVFLENGGEVTAPNGLVKLIRLRQITSGFVTADGEDCPERISNEKIDALEDLLDGITEPVVVFAEFRWDLDAIRTVAEKLGRRYGEVSGALKDGIDENSLMNPNVDVVGVNWKAGGVGIDLTRARYVVIYSSTYSSADYEQGLARVHRPGQTRPVTFYHLVCQQTTDQAVYRAIKRKQDIAAEVTSYIVSHGANWDED
jgi:SNF2 family DNA or RNA helicase